MVWAAVFLIDHKVAPEHTKVMAADAFGKYNQEAPPKQILL